MTEAPARSNPRMPAVLAMAVIAVPLAACSGGGSDEVNPPPPDAASSAAPDAARVSPPDAGPGDGPSRPDGSDAVAPGDDAAAADAGAEDSAPRDSAAPPADAGPGDSGLAISPLAGIGRVELVRGNFVFVEGLRWVPALAALLVSDAYGETIYKHTLPDQFEPFRPKSNGSNCLDLDPQGRVVTAEVGAMKERVRGGVSRRLDDGTWVDAVTDYAGLLLGHPNDIVALPDGNIFFSDLGAHRLFRIDATGALSYPLATGEDAAMNGLGLSPDRKKLYAGAGGMIRVYDVRRGELTFERSIAAGTDGMCVDQEGNIYASTRQGIRVWSPTGQAWGLIPLPELTGGDRATECAFADQDGKTLYISAVTKLFRVRLARAGVY